MIYKLLAWQSFPHLAIWPEHHPHFPTERARVMWLLARQQIGSVFQCSEGPRDTLQNDPLSRTRSTAWSHSFWGCLWHTISERPGEIKLHGDRSDNSHQKQRHKRKEGYWSAAQRRSLDSLRTVNKMVFGSLGFLFGDLLTLWPNLLRRGDETKLSENSFTVKSKQSVRTPWLHVKTYNKHVHLQYSNN